MNEQNINTEQNINDNIGASPINYLQLNNKTYALSEVDRVINIEDELKSYFQKVYDTFRSRLETKEQIKLDEEFNSQLQRIKEINQTNSVNIPQNKFNKPVCWISGRKDLAELKVINYYPYRLKMTLGQIHQKELYDRIPEEFINRFDLDNKPSSMQIELITEHKYKTPLIVGIGTNLVYTIDYRTFHSFGNKDICMGNYNISHYKGASKETLEKYFSKVNYFSLACSEVIEYNTYKRLFTLYDIERDCIIKNIEIEGGDVWRV